MGGDPVPSLAALTWGNFNPRPRMGGDEKRPFQRSILGISIPAPARGATAALRDLRLHRLISIHAPAWGATAKIEKYCF